ncbi:unnamed protein product [Prorocentrum cordatum]|uniref:Solute carrier family 40 protein n=1 Tax=Prorocentrum cordatum TaxID=2364126 RepID=A0ABN9WDA1_9DINO|nr:unnamed protein product [Polarella glacialis]
MLLAPGAALLLKLVGAIRPTAAVLLLEKVVSDSMRTLGGTTMTTSCFSDLFQGKAYTAALGQLTSATGLGIVGAPLLASALMAGSGSARRAYAASAALAAVHLAMGCALLEETLHLGPKRRVALPAGEPEAAGSAQAPAAAAEPILKPVWRFLRMFTETPRLRLCACLFTLHCMLEGKVLQDQVSILQLKLSWDTDWRSRWTSGLGIAILSGGQVSRGLLERCGEHGLTTLCHASSLGAFLALRGASFWSALTLLVVGQQRRMAVASWLLAEATRVGIGRGETIGYLASLRAVCEAASALAYGVAYRRCAARGRPFHAGVGGFS